MEKTILLCVDEARQPSRLERRGERGEGREPKAEDRKQKAEMDHGTGLRDDGMERREFNRGDLAVGQTRMNTDQVRKIELTKGNEGREGRKQNLNRRKQRGRRDKKQKSAKTGFDMGVPFNEINRVFDLGFKSLPWGSTGYLPSRLVAAGSLEQSAAPKSDEGAAKLTKAGTLPSQ